MIESTPTLNVKKTLTLEMLEPKITRNRSIDHLLQNALYFRSRDEECFVIIYNRHLKIDII